MKSILVLMVMVTVASTSPVWFSEEQVRGLTTRQIDPAEYAATMAQNGKLPVTAIEPKTADYPAPGTPEYEAMMNARSGEVSAKEETNPAEYARTMYRTEEEKKAVEVLAKAYTDLMARSQQQAEARIDPKADPVAYAAMMAAQRARAEVDPVEYVRNMYRAEAEQRNKYEAAARSRIDPQSDPAYYAAMMQQQAQSRVDPAADPEYYAAMMRQQQAQARVDDAAYYAAMMQQAQSRVKPEDDPAYYAAMMQQQQAEARKDPKDDPAYYAAMMQYRSEAEKDPAYYAAMMARTGQSSDIGSRFLLQSNFTLNQLITVVQTVVQGEINKTLNAFENLKKNLTSLVGQKQTIQPIVILRDLSQQQQYASGSSYNSPFQVSSSRPSFGRPKPFYPFYYSYPSGVSFYNRQFE